jgi:hypothetical protein
MINEIYIGLQLALVSAFCIVMMSEVSPGWGFAIGPGIVSGIIYPYIKEWVISRRNRSHKRL